jgi:carboxymethylenebutenolidase
MGSMQTVQANGKTVDAYLATPENGSGPGVLVLHAWWGLTDSFKSVSDRLAQAGFVALAPDLYHGKTTASVEEAETLATKLDGEQASQDIAVAIDYLLHQSDRRGDTLGVVGFSLGASFALTLQPPVTAIVSFYGTGTPEEVSTQAKIQCHFADQDDFEPTEWVQQFEQQVRARASEVSFYSYPQTHHWFFEPNRPEYNAEAADLAWQRTIAFLHQQLD